MYQLIVLPFVFVIFALSLSANAENKFIQIPNSHAGISQYQENVVFPKFSSIKIAGTYVGIESNSDIYGAASLQQRVKRFERQVVEDLTDALQTEAEKIMSSTLGLPLVNEVTATTLVVRPSIIDFEVGQSGRKIFASDDGVIINIEVFDLFNGEVMAMASANASIKRESLFHENGLKKNRAKKESEKIAKTLTKMLQALLKDITTVPSNKKE